MNEKLEKWLKNPEAQRTLSKTARSIAEYIKLKHLSPGPADDLQEDIRSDLILFILENRTRIQKLLISGNGHYYLRKAFINYRIEKARKPLKDPQRYLYKHAADVFRASEVFYTSLGRKRAVAFSMHAESIPIPPLAKEDLGEIGFPYQALEKLEYEAVNKKRVLLELGRYFLTQISEIWRNKPVRVDLRDFIKWIGLYVPIRSPVQVNGLYSGSLSDLLPDYDSVADKCSFDPELVRKWARNFAARLNEKESAVFLLRHGYQLGLKEIAEKLGYKGLSGPKYPLDHAERKLRFFLCDLPWLAPDDLNKEAFSLFRDTLIEALSDYQPQIVRELSLNEPRMIGYGPRTRNPKCQSFKGNPMFSRKTALARAKQYRTCPWPSHARHHPSYKEYLQQHLDICPYCSTSLVMEEIGHWEQLTEQLRDAFSDPVSDQDDILPGQLRYIRSDSGVWRDRYFYTPPLVLVVKDAGYSDRVIVAQTYHDILMAGPGDLILTPEQTETDDELFVESGNTFIVEFRKLATLVGKVAPNIINAVRNLGEDAEAYPSWALRPRPITEYDPRVYFRELEAEVIAVWGNLFHPLDKSNKSHYE